MVRRNAILLLIAASLAFGQKAKKLSEEELAKLMEKPENLFLLDVREPDEIKELGSVPGYVNIPLGQLPSRLKEIPKGKAVVTL